MEPLLVTVKGSNIISVCEESGKPEEFKNTWKNNMMRGQYVREMDGKDKVHIWRWLQKIDLKG